MSYSFDFCKSAASDPDRSGFCDRDWSEAQEVSSEEIFDAILNGAREFAYGTDDETLHINIQIVFDPDADFTYFTSESSIHDGTMLFAIQNIYACVQRVLTAGTYDARVEKPQYGDTICYTIGNFVILDEFDMERKKFAPEDKPWAAQRTTVLLPLKVEKLS